MIKNFFIYVVLNPEAPVACLQARGLGFES